MNCQMVLNNTNKNNSILLEVFASVFTVSSYFTDNPRIYQGQINYFQQLCQTDFLQEKAKLRCVCVTPMRRANEFTIHVTVKVAT